MSKPTHQPPVPGPRPVPGPGPQRRTAAAPVAAPTRSDADRAQAVAAATAHGRVDDDLRVFVVTADDEREVGQYPDAEPQPALEYFAGRYIDAVDQADLLEQRLAAGADAAQVRSSARTHLDAVPELAAVGDMGALTAQLSALIERTDAAQEQARADRAARLEEGRAKRTEIVAEAESVAAQDPARTQWKQSAARMRELFDAWKSVQSRYPRLPRAEDQELWGRFSTARSTFDRGRKAHFAQLDARSSEGKRVKEKLIARAEELSHSQEWRDTAAKYRDLMDEWKAAPRAGRRDDDALWVRFRAAQDVFFDARTAENARIDDEYRGNLTVKESLLEEARALLPVKDIDATKSTLRGIQDRWEDAGRVPRADLSRVEGGLREVEKALADAEQAEWERTNPETRARTSGVLAQLEDSIAELEDDLAKARESGDARRIAKAEEALEARRSWFAQLRQTADELA